MPEIIRLVFCRSSYLHNDGDGSTLDPDAFERCQVGDDSLHLEILALDFARDQNAVVVEIALDLDVSAIGQIQAGFDLGAGGIHAGVSHQEVAGIGEFDDITGDLDLGLGLGVIEVVTLALDLRDRDDAGGLELSVHLDRQACPLGSIGSEILDDHTGGQDAGNNSVAGESERYVIANNAGHHRVELHLGRVVCRIILPVKEGCLDDATFIDEATDLHVMPGAQGLEIGVLENGKVTIDPDLQTQDIEVLGISVRPQDRLRTDRPFDLGIVHDLVCGAPGPVFGHRAADLDFHADLEAFLVAGVIEFPVDVDLGAVRVEPHTVEIQTAEALDGPGSCVRKLEYGGIGGIGGVR